MPEPPHSLPVYRCLPCSQMREPPHSLHLLRTLPCSQMLEPPHSLHVCRCLPCSQILEPPHSLHLLRTLPCGHRPKSFAHLPQKYRLLLPSPKRIGSPVRLLHLSSFEPQEFPSNPRQVNGNHRHISFSAQSLQYLSVGLCFGADGSSTD
jgi:hypothetical protein